MLTDERYSLGESDDGEKITEAEGIMDEGGEAFWEGDRVESVAGLEGSVADRGDGVSDRIFVHLLSARVADEGGLILIEEDPSSEE